MMMLGMESLAPVSILSCGRGSEHLSRALEHGVRHPDVTDNATVLELWRTGRFVLLTTLLAADIILALEDDQPACIID